jgi:hypothetical protein
MTSKVYLIIISLVGIWNTFKGNLCAGFIFNAANLAADVGGTNIFYNQL